MKRFQEIKIQSERRLQDLRKVVDLPVLSAYLVVKMTFSHCLAAWFWSVHWLREYWRDERPDTCPRPAWPSDRHNRRIHSGRYTISVASLALSMAQGSSRVCQTRAPIRPLGREPEEQIWARENRANASQSAQTEKLETTSRRG